MSRSNYDKPFYVDIGTSIVAVRCASNHDVVLEYDHERLPQSIGIAEAACDRMNEEAELSEERAVEHATRHAEAVARDNCRDCVHNPRSKNFEGGNAAAMREALERLLHGEYRDRCEVTEIAHAALAAPARNCDVGTAEEQSERMEKSVCSKHYGCVKCPYHRNVKYGDCSLKWAQMPYKAEEGGAK